MALKSFYVRGEFSGRGTPIAGGPKISNKESYMNLEILQSDSGEPTTICEIKSHQNKRRLTTEIKVIPPDGSEPVTHVIETKY